MRSMKWRHEENEEVESEKGEKGGGGDGEKVAVEGKTGEETKAEIEKEKVVTEEEQEETGEGRMSKH